MNVLTDKDIAASPEVLCAAWRASDSFALIPSKGGGTAEWLDRALRLVPAAAQKDHFCLLTSGSTGEPKLIVGKKERAEGLVRVLHGLQNGEAVAETFCLLPLTYSYAFVNQWLWAEVFGRRFHATRGFADAVTTRAELKGARDAMICLVGTQVPLLQQLFGEATFPGIRRVHFAGGRFPQDKLPFLRRAFPDAEIFNNYGCAEAMPRLTLREAGLSDDSACVGTPLPGVTLETGDDGQLLFSSPYGAVGFVAGEEYVPIEPSQLVGTGDLGVKRDDGLWYVLGRCVEVFKRHGEKISLASLERSARELWPRDLAFYREPDPTGEDGHVLVLAPHPEKADVQRVLVNFRKNYPRSHWPIRVESIAQLPLLPNGKVDGKALAANAEKEIHWRQILRRLE